MDLGCRVHLLMCYAEYDGLEIMRDEFVGMQMVLLNTW